MAPERAKEPPGRNVESVEGVEYIDKRKVSRDDLFVDLLNLWWFWGDLLNFVDLVCGFGVIF